MARKPPKQRAKQKASSEARKKKTMSIILAFLMVISLGGIFFGTTQTNTNRNFEYEGYDFELVPDEASGQLIFVTELNDQEVPFYTLPQDALRIPESGGLGPLLRNAESITIATDGNVTTAPVFDEIRFGLDFYGGKATQGATLGPVNGSTLPVRSCVDATPQQPVIEVLYGSASEMVVTENGCVQTSLREIDTALFRDRLLYGTLGVLE